MSGFSSSHPYYPPGADIVGYSPNHSSVLELLVSGGGGCALLLGFTLIIASYVRPTLRMADRIAILWFVLCTTWSVSLSSMSPARMNWRAELTVLTAGTLHCFFEGYFVINNDHMASAQDLFGQLWKEYALSDSRYMTSDTLVLCMETMTVVSTFQAILPFCGFLKDLSPLIRPSVSFCGVLYALLLRIWPQPDIPCAIPSSWLCAWAIFMAIHCTMPRAYLIII